jgi:hypothetical protein
VLRYIEASNQLQLKTNKTPDRYYTEEEKDERYYNRRQRGTSGDEEKENTKQDKSTFSKRGQTQRKPSIQQKKNS